MQNGDISIVSTGKCPRDVYRAQHPTATGVDQVPEAVSANAVDFSQQGAEIPNAECYVQSVDQKPTSTGADVKIDHLSVDDVASRILFPSRRHQEKSYLRP